MIETKRELLRMLSEVNSWRYNQPKAKIPEPSDIKAMRKAVKRFDLKVQNATSKLRKSREKKVSDCRQEIYFGNEHKALKMIKALR